MNEKRTFRSGEYLVFKLGEVRFSLEASRVREVKKQKQIHIAEVPGMPSFFPGVFNLRGNVISAVDITAVMGVEADVLHADAWIVITDLHFEDKPLSIGILVSRVEDVIRLEQNQIGPPPEIGMKVNIEFLQGIAEYGGDYIAILDADSTLAAAETLLADHVESDGTSYFKGRSQDFHR